MFTRKRAAIALVSAFTLAGAGFAAAAHADDHPSGPVNGIVGGHQADNPWVVQLVFTQGNSKYGCSGEAISPEWVLTAQHCIDGTDSMDVFYSNDVTNRGPAIAVDKMVPSPKGDVALVHLSQAHPLDQYGKITSGYTATSGQQGEVQGYGLTANKGKPTHLNAATVDILGESRDAYMGSAIHVRGGDGASNHGDSGGPLIIDGVIVGVCSTGDSADPGSNIHAGSNYANITLSLPWIKETAGVTPDGPTPAPTNGPTNGPTDGPTPAPTNGPTEAPTSAPTELPNPVPTQRPTAAPTVASGAVATDDVLTVAAGQVTASVDVLANDTAPKGAVVRWSGLPAGPSLYAKATRAGVLTIYRSAHIKGDFMPQYEVVAPDGHRVGAKVKLSLR